MDFEDTAEEAEFRAEAAVWLKENGVPKLSDQSMATRRGDPTVVPRARVERQEVRGRFRGHLVAEGVWRAGRLAAAAEHLQSRRTQLCGAAEYLQHQPRYGGADAADLCNRRAKAGTGTERGTTFGASCSRSRGRVRTSPGCVRGPERNVDDWVINGQKIWTSGAHYADRAILVTRSDPEAVKHKGLTYFFLDMKAPGIDVRPIRQVSGYSGFNEVFLTDVRIPDSATPGRGGRWVAGRHHDLDERAGCERRKTRTEFR